MSLQSRQGLVGVTGLSPIWCQLRQLEGWTLGTSEASLIPMSWNGWWWSGETLPGTIPWGPLHGGWVPSMSTESGRSHTAFYHRVLEEQGHSPYILFITSATQAHPISRWGEIYAISRGGTATFCNRIWDQLYCCGKYLKKSTLLQCYTLIKSGGKKTFGTINLNKQNKK